MKKSFISQAAIDETAAVSEANWKREEEEARKKNEVDAKDLQIEKLKKKIKRLEKLTGFSSWPTSECNNCGARSED